MKRITIIDKDVPEEDRPEGMAVIKAITSGKCNVCPYLKRCEADGNFRFPADAACMVIKNNAKED